MVTIFSLEMVVRSIAVDSAKFHKLGLDTFDHSIYDTLTIVQSMVVINRLTSTGC